MNRSTYTIDFRSPELRFYQRPVPDDVKAELCQEYCEELNVLKRRQAKRVAMECADAMHSEQPDLRHVLLELTPDDMDYLTRDVARRSFECYRTRPNCVIDALRRYYPDFHAELTVPILAAHAESKIRSRHFSTYEIDFCKATEYRKPYAGPKTDCKRPYSRPPVDPNDQCAMFRERVIEKLIKDEEDRLAQKPPEPHYGRTCNFGDGSQYKGTGGRRWIPRDRIILKNYTEYMDTINKNGCVIMKNNLHDHTLCENGRHCIHHLEHSCKFMK